MAEMTFKHTQTDSDIQQIVAFLTSSVVFKGDGSYFTVPGPLPLSYYSTPDYWGDYVCNVWAGAHGQDCNVTITDFPGPPYYRNGGNNVGGQLQLERVDATIGTDIYDAACWQIALALAANRQLSGSDPTQLFALVANSTKRLNATTPNIRANTDNFAYGYHFPISDPKEAFALRLVGNDFWAKDPLWDNSKYNHYITFDPSITDYIGSITWPDWKPITGENGWAFLIGPLQSDYLQFYSSLGYIPFASDSIQNALYVLYAFQRMQCPIGAIFYAPGGAEGNQGSIPQGEISIENNASCLAGLTLFKQVLQDTLNKEVSLASSDQAKIKSAINLISIMIWGGTTPLGQTDGLLKFFQTKAWNAAEGIFYTDGIYANNVWQPGTGNSPHAVDVDTWGLTVLGPHTLDSWFGSGTAFTLWQNVKQWGSFSQNGQLWGVGYSSADNHAIMSAEWTAGAINAVRCLMLQHQNDATKFNSLQADHDAMMENILKLRTDQYVGAGFPEGLDATHFASVEPPAGQLAFLYASKRYPIPFGWYANPLPSTTSSSWTIYLHYDYNPFQLGGAYTSLDWAKPIYDPSNDNGPWSSDSIQITVKVQNYASVNLKVVQNQIQLADLPAGSQSAPTSTSVKIDKTLELYILDPTNWNLVCHLPVDRLAQLQEGATVKNDLAWGGICNIL